MDIPVYSLCVDDLMSHLTVGVWVDLCKGPQGETDTVLRAGEAHISEERRHHDVLICGVRAEVEEGQPTIKCLILAQRWRENILPLNITAPTNI